MTTARMSSFILQLIVFASLTVAEVASSKDLHMYVSPSRPIEYKDSLTVSCVYTGSELPEDMLIGYEDLDGNYEYLAVMFTPGNYIALNQYEETTFNDVVSMSTMSVAVSGAGQSPVYLNVSWPYNAMIKTTVFFCQAANFIPGKPIIYHDASKKVPYRFQRLREVPNPVLNVERSTFERNVPFTLTMTCDTAIDEHVPTSPQTSPLSDQVYNSTVITRRVGTSTIPLVRVSVEDLTSAQIAPEAGEFSASANVQVTNSGSNLRITLTLEELVDFKNVVYFCKSYYDDPFGNTRSLKGRAIVSDIGRI